MKEEQKRKLDELCNWLALESFGDGCAKQAAKNRWVKRAYHRGRSDAFTAALAKVRELFAQNARPLATGESAADRSQEPS